MQIKTTMRYYLTPVRMFIISRLTNKFWRDCGQNGAIVYYWWECRSVQPLWKAVWSYLRQLKMELHYNPVIPLYLKKPETLIPKNICTSMFIAVLFKIAKIWKQSKYPISKWMGRKAVVHLHSGILFSYKNEGNLIFCDSMAEAVEHCAKWNKPVRERQIPYYFTYM